jgi:hypothetical protein
MKKRGGWRPGSGRKRTGRKEWKLTAEELIKLLHHVEAVRRYYRISRRKACWKISYEGLPDLPAGAFDRDPLDLNFGENSFTGTIDGSGFVRGSWTDDPSRSFEALNFSARELENLFYDARRAMRAKRAILVHRPKRPVSIK